MNGHSAIRTRSPTPAPRSAEKQACLPASHDLLTALTGVPARMAGPSERLATSQQGRLTPDTARYAQSVEPAVRTARADDIPAVLALWRQAQAEPGHTDDIRSLQRLIAHDYGALLVAEADQRIVGSVIAAWDGWRGSIYRLAVAPPQRHQGLGRRLVSEAEKRLAALGAVRLQAIVVQTDARATGFWRASNWHEQTRRLRFTRG